MRRTGKAHSFAAADLAERDVESDGAAHRAGVDRLAPTENPARASVCFGWESVGTAVSRGMARPGCSRLPAQAARRTVAGLPLLLGRRRTARSVAAYFDLITDEARRFYGGQLPHGLLHCGEENLER